MKTVTLAAPFDRTIISARRFIRSDFSDWHIPYVPEQHVIYLLVSGERRACWDDEIVTLRQGDIVLFPAHISFDNPLPEAPYEAISITFSAHRGDSTTAASKGLTINWHTRSKHARLASYFEEIAFAADSPDIFARMRLPHILAALFIDLAREHAEPDRNSRIAFIRKEIDTDPSQPRTEVSCAEKASMSVSTFKRLFYRECGMSLKEYQLRRRIADASAMIASSPKKTFHDIALSLGFYDEFHFSRMFKKFTGMDPRAYRNTAL
ncbi:MAG: helix-turn-helix transcriptional regulator [Spirochaetes bacterium]|nr:helix-turn-helix transcriptional regulator [Spirochaetota bacterium]